MSSQWEEDKNPWWGHKEIYKQQVALKQSILRLFRAYDAEVGGESDLSPLEISTVAHRAVNEYVEEAQRRLEEE
jgi:hypothetical protein